MAKMLTNEEMIGLQAEKHDLVLTDGFETKEASQRITNPRNL